MYKEELLVKKGSLVFILLVAVVLMLSILIEVPMEVKAMSSEPVKEENFESSPIPKGAVRIHYHRFDDDYKGWGLHLWGDGYNGSTVDWGSPVKPSGRDTYGVYWDVYKREGSLNFIIHKGDLKDPDGDRSYPDSRDNKEIWTVSGDIKEYLSIEEAKVNMGNRIENAIVVDKNNIRVKFRKNIRDLIKIKDENREVAVFGAKKQGSSSYLVKTKEELDGTKQYTVVCGDMKAKTILRPEDIDKKYSYKGRLGAFYTSQETEFKLWAPIASDVKVKLYKTGQDKNPYKTIKMSKGDRGVWSVEVAGDLLGQFYKYDVTNNGVTKEILDPYAKSMAGFNSDIDKIGKGAIIDLSKTNPKGWSNDDYVNLKDQEDAIIYEMSVRDFTIADNSGVADGKRGTYVGFIEKIPHLKELGITHVQLMPVLNWYYGDEFNKDFEEKGSSGEANYNWGYDPHNYFTPEGWYSQDPANPHLRVKELKELVKALHDAGIGVVLDVVYNHTANTDIFEPIVPYYYYRRDERGNFANGSGCGNETASERDMMRKFIIDSTTYWVDEYHVDGFRFDLMGLHDEKTVMDMAKAVREINPMALIHGEGWNMGNVLAVEDKYIKGDNKTERSLLEYKHAPAAFSDSIRDSIVQPSAFAPASEGAFIQGASGNDSKLRTGVIAGMYEFDPENILVSQTYDRFADDPEEVITYVTCHDGRTLWDKINLSAVNASKEEKKRMHKLASAIILTSQGKSFLHGGVEMLRSKTDPDREDGIDHNSYDSGDLVNQIDWSLKDKNSDVFNYLRGLIKLRRAHEAFRMETMPEIQKGINFLKLSQENLVGYRLTEEDGEDSWNEIIVIYNGNREDKTIDISGVDSSWSVVVDGENAGVEEIVNTDVEINNKSITVPAISAVVLHN